MTVAKEKIDNDFFFKVVLIGDSDVGKTSVFRCFKTGSFAARRGSASTERDKHCKVLLVDGKRVELELWDTAGQEKFRSLTSSYVRGARAVIFMYDITHMESLRNLKNWHQLVDRYIDENSVQVLIGNKKDLELSRKVPKEEAKKSVVRFGMSGFFESSAKEFRNITEVFELIARTLKRQRDGQQSLFQSRDSSIILGASVSSEVKKSWWSRNC